MLDPEITAMLEVIKASRKTPWNQIPLPSLRHSLLKAIEAFDMPEQPLAEVINTKTDFGIPVRIYRPRTDAILPVVMYLHGGGWVTLNLDSHDHFCRHLAKTADCIVASVDFRLAPEHRFPAGLEDAIASWMWMLQQLPAWGGDPNRTAIAGDSTGANIAISTSTLLLSDPGVRPGRQCLIYPVTDLITPTESRRLFADNYGVTSMEFEFYERNYLNNPEQRFDARVSPIVIEDFSQYMPTMIFTAEYDPLRDEGNALAQKMSAQGVTVTHRCYSGLIHGFLQMGSVPIAMAAITDIAQTLAASW